jgi:hypothetical protein
MIELLLTRGIDYHHKQSNGDDVFVWASSPEVKKILHEYIKK